MERKFFTRHLSPWQSHSISSVQGDEGVRGRCTPGNCMTAESRSRVRPQEARSAAMVSIGDAWRVGRTPQFLGTTAEPLRSCARDSRTARRPTELYAAQGQRRWRRGVALFCPVELGYPVFPVRGKQLLKSRFVPHPNGFFGIDNPPTPRSSPTLSK